MVVMVVIIVVVCVMNTVLTWFDFLLLIELQMNLHTT